MNHFVGVWCGLNDIADTELLRWHPVVSKLYRVLVMQEEEEARKLLKSQTADLVVA